MKIEERLQTTGNLSESKKVVLNMLVGSTSIKDYMSEILKPFALSGPQFNVLRILRGQKGKPANLETIQQRMIHRNSNTTRLVDKLIEKKLAERIVCEKNRRKVEITINENGLELLEKIDPKVKKVDELICGRFSKKELKQLNLLLEKLQDFPPTLGRSQDHKNEQ